MKVNFNTTVLGEAIVWRSESDTRPGLFHYTFKLRHGGMVCSCEGWQYNAFCKHLERAPVEAIERLMANWRD
jgi:hypothetical protein